MSETKQNQRKAATDEIADYIERVDLPETTPEELRADIQAILDRHFD